MMKYNHSKVEKKWQSYWEAKKIFVTKDNAKGKKHYILDMFPYPSGAGLHVGHPEGYTATDILSRYMRHKGFNVLHPMGWDAFGLPAENYAIKMGVHPQKTTQKNIKRFTEQIKSIGLSYDWTREVNTSDPGYYQWTQWLFLQLYKKGLAYKKEAYVNWCPKDNTVLANEQVVDGKCERCGTEVVQKNLSQWFFKITDYADRLLEGLEGLDWPEPIKLMQRNWIGKSEGAEISFPLNLKRNFVILHGFTATPQSDFHPWLKKELESRGYKVTVPALPHTKNPTEEEQVAFVLQNCTFDENTVLIGHSLGSVVAMKVLEKLGHSIAGLVVVGGFVKPKFKDHDRVFANKFNWEFDFQKIKDRAGSIKILHDPHDVAILNESADVLSENFGASVTLCNPLKTHFCGLQEPVILENILSEVKVFTTRPDTLFGATYMVLAPEHQLVQELRPQITNWTEVEKYIVATQKKSELQRTQLEKEKTGVELKGVKAINPATKEEIPVWIADYVITGYGTGAIMAVPAHDQRDFEFAKKFNLPIKQVVAEETGTERPHEERRDGGCAIIFDPSSQKYAVAKLQENGRYWLYAGGINQGEDVQAAVLREVREESGLHDFKHIEQIGSSFTHYYNTLKKVNRLAQVTCFLVVLNSVDQKSLQLEDHEKFDLVWATPEEILHNWQGWNKDHDVDHWIKYLQDAVSRAVELGFDKTSKKDKYVFAAAADKGMLIESGEFTGIHSWEAFSKIASKFGNLVTKYKLRDWLVSRQRYWGAPIPIRYCEKCGMQPVPEKELPIKLPTDVDFRPTGESPLARSKKFKNVKCPKCKGKAVPDFDTMDTFVDSSWYFLRYTDPKNKKAFADKSNMKAWLPVNMYVGGAEHAVLHLLYSRFFTKALKDFKLLNFEEPFLKLRNQGLILGPDGEKMSKSRGNVINPDDVIKEFGADSLRMYEMFMGPLEDAKPWMTNGIVGVKRFLDRVWVWTNEVESGKVKVKRDSEKIEKALHKLIKKITEDIESFSFNTAISSFMEFHNEIRQEPVTVASLKTFLILLYPFAPHMCEELHQILGGKKSLQLEPWPKFNPKKIVDETVEIIIQVNGKVKGKVTAPAGSTEEEIKKLVLAVESVKNAIGSNAIKRLILVPNRLVNLVI